MFETTEIGRSVSKKAFKEAEGPLRTALLEAQRKIREHDVPVVVIVSGVEGAGKGDVVSQLHTWLDARGLVTHTYWDETDEERERPFSWRFWRTLPSAGQIGILFGSWYTQPIVQRAFDKIDEGTFRRKLDRIAAFERMLEQDGALIVKFWYHLSAEGQQARLTADIEAGLHQDSSPLERYSRLYNTFVKVSEDAIRATDTGGAPWHIIEASDARYRDLYTGQILLARMEQRLAIQPVPPIPPVENIVELPGTERTVLDQVDLKASLDSESYTDQLAELQSRLRAATWTARRRGVSTVLVFEGWDAAGKGGAIRRLTGGMDARLYTVIPVGAPTDEESAHHYLWRFWRRLPRAGRVTVYDRSWYGRVLVERVEGFATAGEWSRSYHEITHFEEQLTDHGIVLCKFWLHISPKEQLRRFEERKLVPWKKHKITDEDWRNRERWQDYRLAVHDMVTHTSTRNAPWTLVAANDKRHARVQVLQTVVSRLESALEKLP